MKAAIEKVCPMKFATMLGDGQLCDGERCMWFVRMNKPDGSCVEFCAVRSQAYSAHVREIATSTWWKR